MPVLRPGHTASPAVASLNAAVELLRSSPLEYFGRYTLAILPLSVSVLLMLEVVDAEERSAIPGVSMIVVGALIWRAILANSLQRSVFDSIQNQPSTLTLNDHFVLTVSRVNATALGLALSWLIVPAFIMVSVEALLLSSRFRDKEQGKPSAWRALSVVVRHPRVQAVYGLSIGFVLFVLYVGVLSLVVTVGGTLLPSLLGIDTTDFQLAMQSAVWFLGVLFICGMVVDLLTLVSGPILFSLLAQHESGADLLARIRGLREGHADD